MFWERRVCDGHPYRLLEAWGDFTEYVSVVRTCERGMRCLGAVRVTDCAFVQGGGMLHGRGVRAGKRRTASHIGDKDALRVGGII